MKISFDVISDLNLSSDEFFDWYGKSSSLYCIVAGNISDDISVIKNVFSSLSKNYHCVLYIPGKTEFSDTESVAERLIEISVLAKTFDNIVLLYNHVCIVDGVALIAAICDYGDLETHDYAYQQNDFEYLKSTIQRLQKHKDVKSITCVTAAAPTLELYCGEVPASVTQYTDFTQIKQWDTENKISHWVYSGSQDSSEQNLNNVSYVCNPSVTVPYYPTRILI